MKVSENIRQLDPLTRHAQLLLVETRDKRDHAYRYKGGPLVLAGLNTYASNICHSTSTSNTQYST